MVWWGGLRSGDTGVDAGLRAAAFGDRPGDPVTGTAGAGDYDRWLIAVVLGGQGRYAAAATLLGGLRTHPDPVLAALAASTLASHRRQLGGHQSARALDAFALRGLAEGGLAGVIGPEAAPDRDGIGPEGAHSDALLGLAADALGLGLLGTARRLLARAEPVSRSAGWRGLVRWHWVSAEVELASGRAAAALPHAESAAREAAAAGAVRHEVKSSMVLAAATGAVAAGAGGRARGRAGAAAMSAGVAMSSASSLASSLALSLASATLDRATRLGLAPLVWPCALLMADLDPSNAGRYREQAARTLHGVLQHSDPLARRLAAASPWVPTGP